MKKNLLSILTVLCLLLTFSCLAEEEEIQVDVTFEAYGEAGGTLYVTGTDEADEYGGLGLIGTVGQTLGEMLQSSDILSIEPLLEGDVFEGWMEVAESIVIDEFGFEETVYSLIPDPCYTTEELMALPVPDHHVTYVAKWASIPAEEYFAPYEEETIVMSSITLLCGEGSMLINGEEEQYEVNWSVATVEPGQSFGEVLELDTVAALTAEGKVFIGWTVYEYNVAAMEISESWVEAEGVLCFELFEDYHMVLHDYMTCAELLSTGELAEYGCEASDHAVVAVWMTAEEYLDFVQNQANSILASLENDPLTQMDMNLKSQELRELWEAALAVALDEIAKILPENELHALTAQQTAWQETTEKAAAAAGKEFEGGSMHALIVNSEAAERTEARVYELYALLK